MREIFFSPIIFLCAFFKDLYNSLEISRTKIIAINVVFSTCISVVYGLLFGLYIIFFAMSFLKGTIINIRILLISCISVLEVIQLGIIYSLREDTVIFPEVYLNVFLLGVHMQKEKYLIKFIFKLIILSTVLFILFTILAFSIYIPEQAVLPMVIVTFSLSILITLMILNKVKLDKLKKSINQMILTWIVFVSFFSFGIISLFFYKNPYSVSILLEIGILIFSLHYGYATIPDLTIKVYKKFLEEFNENINFTWNELQESYGFTKFKRKAIKELNEFRNGIVEIKNLWRNGQRTKVIKRFVNAILFLVFYWTIMFFLFKYENTVSNVISSGTEMIKNYLVKLFDGNALYAGASFIIIISFIAMAYNLWKVVICVKRKYSLQEIRVYIARVFMACLVISIMVLAFDELNSTIYSIYRPFGIIFAFVIVDTILIKMSRESE